MAMADKLVPCPFCGGKVELFPSLRFKGYYVIFCPACCIKTEAVDDADALCEEWNKVGGWKKEGVK